MENEELGTLSEAIDAFERGEIKEGNFVVCKISKQAGGRIWIPYSELAGYSELRKLYNKEVDNIMFGDYAKKD